ncbi:MAG: radical SAM protein [Candidatus Asgardarchaeia archaeon]
MVSNDVNKIRVSIGTAVAIGLNSLKIRVLPKTAYLMTFSQKKCMENCLFCVQARTSRVPQNHLSRIIWPEYDLNKVVKALSLAISSGKIKRVCIQTIKTPSIIEDLIYQLEILSKAINKKVPLSVAIHPIEISEMKKIKDLGVTDLSISFDAVTPEIFDKVKGKYVGNSYTWEGHWRGLLNAIKVFGSWHVNTHVIIGLGEKEVDVVRFLQNMVNLNVTVGLMALTPIKGTGVENYKPPPIDKYRRIQLAYYLIRKGFTSFSNFKFDNDGKIVDFGISKSKLINVIKQGYPFMTTGCPFCDRPYYNESPRGPIYNYPFKPTSKDIKSIEEEVNI